MKYYLTGPVYLGERERVRKHLDGDEERAKLKLPPDKYIEAARIGFEIRTPLGPIRMQIGKNNFSGHQQASLSVGNWR